MPTLQRDAVFHAISNEARRRILEQVARGELPATSLVAPFDISQPAVSRHLKVLRDAGLVRVRTHGRERLYSLDAGGLQLAHGWLSTFETFWTDRLAALGAHLARSKE